MQRDINSVPGSLLLKTFFCRTLIFNSSEENQVRNGDRMPTQFDRLNSIPKMRSIESSKILVLPNRTLPLALTNFRFGLNPISIIRSTNALPDALSFNPNNFVPECSHKKENDFWHDFRLPTFQERGVGLFYSCSGKLKILLVSRIGSFDPKQPVIARALQLRARWV